MEGLFPLLGANPLTSPGGEYRLVDITDPAAAERSGALLFVRWSLPVHHSWPCRPARIDGFIEKAAQALAAKFAPHKPQTVLVGQLQPGSPDAYHKSLASNLRGRMLQVFPPMPAPSRDAEAQDSRARTLFCLVGKEGLYAGLISPLEANGFHPGGAKHIRLSGEESISRAGAKIAEALHHLRLRQAPPPVGSHWLELGASPGGMTSELLTRGYRVTAVDRAPLDRRLHDSPALKFVHSDVSVFQPLPAARCDAMLCDMNGDSLESMRQVCRLSSSLRPGGLIVFTLKLPEIFSAEDALARHRAAVREAESAGLTHLNSTHLTHNRQEFTVFLEKRG